MLRAHIFFLFALILFSCNENKQDTTYYLLLGTYSPSLEKAKIGDSGTFTVGDPKYVNYGRIEVEQGKLLSIIQKGGHVISIAPPEVNQLKLTGNAKVTLHYGIIKLNTRTQKAILTHKGEIEAGAVSISIF